MGTKKAASGFFLGRKAASKHSVHWATRIPYPVIQSPRYGIEKRLGSVDSAVACDTLSQPSFERLDGAIETLARNVSAAAFRDWRIHSAAVAGFLGGIILSFAL